MAATKGYECEFIDSVNEDFYCKICTLVARSLSIATCCGESFCHACIVSIQEQGKPCPECGGRGYNIIERPKNQARINCFQVYCSMKEVGCDWSGTLEQLDTHLDPGQDNCQYVDTKCPLNCHMTISKSKVEQHVAQHCAKRPYVCQYCNYKATYEEVVKKHLVECKYVPLQCPNLCGVTLERDFMEEHMKMCRLEEVRCEFNGVGCDDRFRREDQEEHTRQNSQKHLTLTASLAVETKEQLQQKSLEEEKKHKEVENKLKEKMQEQEKKLLEQDKKHKEEVEKLKEKIQEQGMKSDLQKKMLIELEKKLEEEERKQQCNITKLEDQNELQRKLTNQVDEQQKDVCKLKEKLEEVNEVHKKKLEEQEQQHNLKLQKIEKMLKEVTDKAVQNEVQLSKTSSIIFSNRRFEMKNFSHDKFGGWKSPTMYTHMCGYKFCIGVGATRHDSLAKSSYFVLELWAVCGEFDYQLKWPAKAKFTIEFINPQQKRENESFTLTTTWNRPAKEYEYLDMFARLYDILFVMFLKNDTLYFNVSDVVLL